ncbi:conserved hypothetical protein, (Acyl carrier protein) [Bradyrhizobium sp. ORS 375]|uniref:hypothetical protein n=1 Tax=Bradyrhizobium sp. (strain ORS 375) TaxID=566679 RepID=UPI00024085E5|nr:hypothetical protein [Bradyrhizobium sp. ORS 375]CCD93825.1 conserved hypothetical protein, (Acyl carrier protein) [Bradyrhizobium sp. ORS 375]
MVSFEEFSDFIRDVTNYTKSISPETDVVHDLGVAGADGGDFARALQDTYGLRLTDDEIAQHFGQERAMTPWHLLIWLWDQADRLKPLTVKELYERIGDIERGTRR